MTDGSSGDASAPNCELTELLVDSDRRMGDAALVTTATFPDSAFVMSPPSFGQQGERPAGNRQPTDVGRCDGIHAQFLVLPDAGVVEMARIGIIRPLGAERAVSEQGDGGRTLLEVSGLECSYGPLQVLFGVDLAVPDGG